MRIGLRYCDLVLVDDGEEITDLVSEHFGLPNGIVLLGKARHHSTDTCVDTNEGVLEIRTLYGIHNLTCLPDVQGLAIFLSLDSMSSERIIFDFDHYWEVKDEPVRFDTNDVLEKLAALHETSKEAFLKFTTDYARYEK